ARPTAGFGYLYTAARLLQQGFAVSRFYDNAWFGARVGEYAPGVFDLYSPNPPTVSLILLPLAGLDYASARGIWMLFNLICLSGIVGVLGAVGGHRRGVWVLAFIALALAYQPLYAVFRDAQVYGLLLGLLVAAWYGYRRRRDGWLGAALGLLLVFKLAGLWLWPLLVVERRWRALAWGAATALAVCVVSLPWLGIEAWLAGFRALAELGGQPSNAVTAYQTLMSLTRHLTTYDAQWNPSPWLDWPALGAWLFGLGFLMITGLSLYQAHRSGASNLAFAALVAAGVILSPSSLDYHYLLMLLPIALLIAEWQRRVTRFNFRLVIDDFRLTIINHTSKINARHTPAVVQRAASTGSGRTEFIPVVRGVLRALAGTPVRGEFNARRLAPALLLIAIALIAADLPYRSPRLAEGAWALLAYPKLAGAMLIWGLAVWPTGRSALMQFGRPTGRCATRSAYAPEPPSAGGHSPLRGCAQLVRKTHERATRQRPSPYRRRRRL
ncbi:MAG: DUF2029 domain-containing protein, partial [Chloroflexi bacterium]|nr:DUF2029 domain-containing protein [Chloroflexota bacterium]